MELRQFKRTLRQALLLPIIACLLFAGILVWQIDGTHTTVVLLEQSGQRITLATQIEKLVVDEETGLRGYQITADPRFLSPYQDAEAPMQQLILQLQAIALPEQQDALNQFVAEHQTWHQGFAEPIIALMAAGAETGNDDLNLTGRVRMDHMRAMLDEIIRISEERRAVRIAEWRQQQSHLYILLFVLSLCIGLIIGLFMRDRLNSVNAAFRRSLDLRRSRAEELFQSEQNLRTTLASIGDGVITCDIAGTVQMMNPVAQQLTGWTESEARARPLREVFPIIHETTRLPVESPVEKVLRLNSIASLANHTVLIRKDGSEISIDDSGAPIRNEAGVMTGIVMVFRDITMERRTRAALLANEKLAVAGRLAATIAHEIHNPLDSVANLLYLLKNDPKDNEAQHFLDVAQSELARVTQISRAMLSLYRESKAPVAIPLNETLNELLMLMAGRFQTLGVHITMDSPLDITIDGFPAELRQVFTNLITNAAEAAGDNGNISIRVVAQEAGISRGGLRQEAGAIVTISDDGPGIPPEVKDRLFQPFFTTKGERGTGLGLWVSQGIIRKHGGTIRLESPAPGSDHGAVATVFLASKPIIDPGGD